MSSDTPTTTDGRVGTETRALSTAAGAIEVLRATSAEVDEQLSVIDDRAADQAEEIGAIVEEVSELSATIEEVAASAEQVATRSTEAADRAAEGREAASEAGDVVGNVRTTSEDLLEDMQRLEERIEHIEEALSGIDDIAEQTNMLAINASIEAARAEDSDGFAVVAEEIKTLAEESREQADAVESSLQEVRAAADRTASTLETTVAEIETGRDFVETAEERFEAVAETVERTATDVQSVSAATDDLATSSEEIATGSEDVADSAQAIRDDIVAIREARGEQTTMLGEVGDAIAVVTTGAEYERVPSGLGGLDDLVGGLIEGGQIVLEYEQQRVADVVASVTAGAVATGGAVSLTPPPSLDRGTLRRAFAEKDVTLETTLADDRLFVLDAFDTWQGGSNVFDLGTRSLTEANRETDRRRDRPLLIVGNIAGEIATLGEEAARAARFENDDGVFGATDTVLNVVDRSTVAETMAAFYAGAADQVFRLVDENDRRHVVLATDPTVSTPVGGRIVAGEGRSIEVVPAEHAPTPSDA
ncbi:methyl-accepting chemotaxis protein [Halorhabdus amylolytica]|uniref:methyl-accepting chemotaxis protein n=1 Tax=Halorhabdus amylolytica TaxID=2559573 RepID=UPI0010AA6588|nr:methyl-accepting chemotaxis protein [Halorhabdus amylolytica]